VDTLRGYVRDAELFRDHAGAGSQATGRAVPVRWVVYVGYAPNSGYIAVPRYVK